MASLVEADPTPSIEPISEEELQEAIMMDTENYLTLSNFALVIFDQIPKTYPINTDIECNFILTQGLQPSTKDWIGLYRVGWQSSRTYCTYNYVPPLTVNLSEKNIKGGVTFLAAYLPKDDSEFYQFCYVACNDHIRGASTPFQFKKTYLDDYIELEDKNEELMIVQSKAALMEDQLKTYVHDQVQLQKCKVQLQKDKELLKNQYDDLTLKLEKEKEKSEEYYNKLQKAKHDVEIAQHRIKSMKEENDHLVDTISRLTSSNETLKHTITQRAQDLNVLEQDIKKLIIEKNALSGRIKIREEDLTLLKNNLHASLLNHKILIADLESRLVTEQTKNNVLQENLKEETLALKAIHEAEQKECKDLIVRLQQNLTLMETQCKASEKCQEMLTGELNAYSALREKLTADVETSQGEAHSLKLQLSKLEEKRHKDLTSFDQANNLLRAEMTELKKENDLLKVNLDKKYKELVEIQNEHLLMEKENGALFALQQAHSTLQKRYNLLEKQLSIIAEKHRMAEQKESNLQRENTDLRDRLQKGAKEWRSKYLECQSLKKEVSQKLFSSSRECSQIKDRAVSDGLVECDEESLIVVHKFPDTFHESVSAKSSTSSSSSRTAGLPETDQVCKESNDLRHVLSTCVSKKEKYRTLYKGEQERCAALELQLDEKDRSMQEGLKRQNSLHEDLKAEFQQKFQNLQGIIEVRDIEIADLRENLQRIAQQNSLSNPLGINEVRDIEIADLRENLQGIAQQNSLSNHLVILQKPVIPRISYYSSIPNINGNSDADEITITLPLPTTRVICNDYNEVGSISDEASSSDNLPPPLQATVLPSAKIAAITAVSRQMSPSSVSATIDNSELDDVFTDGDNDADRSSSVSPRASISRSSSFIISNVSESSFELAPEDIEPSFHLCPVCATRFSSSAPFTLFEDHVYTHYGPICPMCNVQFSTDFTHGDFLRHVHGHFED